MKIEKKVLSTIKKFSLIKPGETVLCAVSGGPDSVALLHILNALSRTLNIKVCAAHFNHKLRGAESEADEKFVKDLCSRLSIPLITGYGDIKKASSGRNIEEIARKERYRFLQAAASQLKASKIAVGHTASDLCETVIFNISKGTGIKGIRGFLPKRDNIIRPLFEVTREEIENYLKNRKIPFRIDSSNLDTKFSRNLIRLCVIPHLRKINPSLEKTILRESKTFREIEDFLKIETEKILKKGTFHKNSFSISLKHLHQLHPFIKKEAIREAFSRLSGESLNATKIAAIASLTEKNGSGTLHLKGDFIAVKTQTHLLLSRKTKNTSPFNIKVTRIPSEVETPEGIFEFTKTGTGDFEFPETEIKKGLLIKSRSGGEWLSFPYGKKKLKKFLNEKKIPFFLRNNLPLLVTGENEVIWIPGLYKKTYIKENTTERIIVRYKGELKSADNGRGNQTETESARKRDF
ncbi:tRNA lysidine(34) synthetase TilS [Desulfurobacterium sp.]